MASSLIKQKIKKNEPQNSGYKKPKHFKFSEKRTLIKP